MKIQVITLFPEMFEGVLGSSMLWKASKNQLVEYGLINLRDFGQGTRKTVDDTPYGGGDGMLLKVEPLVAAIEKAQTSNPNAKKILLTPRGEVFNQTKAQVLSKEQGLILICGRYEGYDERVVEFVDQQISIGQFVLTGGELPAMMVLDSVVRLIPGVLGGEESAQKESFGDGETVEHPHYTRPEEFRGLKVPDVLLSGDHQAIEQWRVDNSSKK
jgi:tRNA (guanine37-N1)-methyltransferase